MQVATRKWSFPKTVKLPLWHRWQSSS